MVRPASHSVSFTFKCQSTAVVLFRSLAAAERILWNRDCLFFSPVDCLYFLGIWSLYFYEFWHGARNSDKVVHDRAGVFGKNLFYSLNWGNEPNLNLKKNLVINFHWICSIMRVCIICCVPAQILYWKKSFSWYVGQIAPQSVGWDF